MRQELCRLLEESLRPLDQVMTHYTEGLTKAQLILLIDARDLLAKLYTALYRQ